MDMKPGFKHSGVGPIPAAWSERRLGDIAAVGSGGTPSRDNPSYWNGSIPWITTSQIDFNEISEAGEYITDAGLNNSAAKLLPAGTLLMALYGQGKTRGKVGVLTFEAATNQACASIVIGGGVSAEFVRYFLTNRYDAIRSASNGGSQDNLSGQIVKSLPVVLPPLPEQQAIAAALSDVDALLGALDRLIAKNRDLKQAAMHQLLTGQTRLPGFSGKWETKRLGEVLERITNGAVYSAANREGVPITRIETIADGTIDYARTGLAKWSSALAQYELRRGDILFSHINSIDHIGKVALFAGDRPLYHGMNLLLLRAGTGCDATFLYFWLSSEPARRRMRTLAKQAVSQASINTAELRLVSLDLPSVPEQEAISTVLSDVDAELNALEQRRDKTRLLKQGMMQELLTGRTRLV